jgi:hypothetical protein
VAVVGTVVGVNMRFGPWVIRLGWHADARGERGHDDEHQRRERLAGQSGRTHAQRYRRFTASVNS